VVPVYLVLIHMVLCGMDILQNCAAIIFAADAASSEALASTALRLGFGHAEDYTKLANVPPKIFHFYIVHGALPDAAKVRLVRSIRTSPEYTRKYAPIICALASGPRHLIVPLIDMGFDEVLFLNDPDTVLAQKLRGQLLADLLFIESPHYFGPDRRRIELVDRGDTRRKAGANASGFRKINVKRDPVAGISARYIS